MRLFGRRKETELEFTERKKIIRSGPRARIRSARVARSRRTVAPEHSKPDYFCPTCSAMVMLANDSIRRCVNGHIWTP